MELKNMCDGSDKTIKIGFLFQQSSDWMGGINYFKNLFIAMSKVACPKLVPCIFTPQYDSAKILLNYAQLVDFTEIKSLKYRLKKILYQLIKRKFKHEKYITRVFTDIELTSHSPISKNFPAISWIPDFQHLHLPEMFPLADLKGINKHFLRQAKNSKIIIVSSGSARDDFKNIFPAYAHKVRVLNFVAILDDDVYKKTDAIKTATVKKFDLPDKYFYLPNQFWKHKNHTVVLDAITILKKQNHNIKVVFSGNTKDYRNQDFFDELMTFIKDKDISDNVKILGMIDAIEVYYLMRNCISVINPSLFEGWSSTVEEVKSLGKSIILSNIAVHQEQNPPNATYFNPNDANELSEMLKEQWINKKSEPDYELEKIARETIEERITNFGKQYQQIVLETLIGTY